MTLEIHEIDRIHADLPRLMARCGRFDIGLIQQFYRFERHLRIPDRWNWRFCYLDLVMPDAIACGGAADTKDDAVADLTKSWSAFTKYADMTMGDLRLVRQEDLERGRQDYSVTAGGFRMGRIHEDGGMSPPIWPWTMFGFFPGPSGAAPSREQAMNEIKSAWIVICEMTQTPAN